MKHAPFLTCLLALPAIAAADVSSPDAWERFNDWSIGDVLFPNLHLHGVGGFTSGDAAELATGGHDPRREAFSAQAIEPGLSLRTEYLEGFANYLWFQDAEGDWDGELEEAFGKITNIPGGLELRGGQYLSRFGTLNDKHIHAWDFIDSEIVSSRFLGEDGLILQGGELGWMPSFASGPTFTAMLTLGFGNARAHEHDHGHGEEDHDEEEDENHDEDHAHGHGGGLFDGEESALEDDIWTARAMGRYRFSDFRSVTAGLSWAGGKNGFGRDTNVVGLDAEYLWRENGLERGGRAFRWRNELLWREAEAYDVHMEDDGPEIHEGTYREWGFYSHAIYTWHERLDTGLRLGWVEGVEDFGQSERFRVSPVVSWWFDDARRVGLRAQYNYDAIASREDEHSLWLQFNVALGSNVEVR
ncbi:MAG TPA: hypothetical protein VLO11_13325 [Luteolibacter sp.]|nr:hypothetical protein [Luteolibacter sp.]